MERAGLAAVLMVAAGLRLWRIDDSGFGTEYYAAGVRSMLQGGRLFFYNAFDPAGFVSLDKPPLAFWIQAAFAALLGFSGWTIHLPQALAGTISVAVLYGLVRRPFGAPAGLIATFILAITPVAVAVDRSNNTDSWLMLLLLLAARAVLSGRGTSFVAAMALLGLAFNIKMLAALVCGPALLAAYLVAHGSTLKTEWRRQLGWLSAGAAVLAIVSLSWAVAYDLTPRDDRPYAGSSIGNSMLELIVAHNGLERFVRNRPPLPTAATADTTPRPQAYDAVPVGPLRLAHPNLAAQFAWLLPIAAFGLAAGWRRHRASTALWGVWSLAYGIVYSAAGGIFHLYYLVTLAPPLAALAGIGAVALWRQRPWLLSVVLVLAALWQAGVLAGPFGWQSPWMALPGIVLVAAAAILLDRRAALLGAIALAILPAAWALSAIWSPGNRMLPSASLGRWLGVDDGRGVLLSRNFSPLSDDPKLHAFLLAQRGAARFVVAAPSTWLAAPIIVRTGAPAMAVGGFSGNDPILTADAFAKKVARGEVRFALLSNSGVLRRRADAASPNDEWVRWVRRNGVPVKEELWRSRPPEPRRWMALYDLDPQRLAR